MKLTPNGIALASLILSCVLMAYIFKVSHEVLSLQLAVLVSATNMVASLNSIASTLLTGRDVSTRKPLPDEQPNPTLEPKKTQETNR